MNDIIKNGLNGAAKQWLVGVCIILAVSVFGFAWRELSGAASASDLTMEIQARTAAVIAEAEARVAADVRITDQLAIQRENLAELEKLVRRLEFVVEYLEKAKARRNQE